MNVKYICASKMQRYFIQIAYDGTSFNGWQRQKNAHSVQAELETALSRLLREEIVVVGCGRTDTGVHASDYFAHFDTVQVVDCETIRFKINTLLNHLITVKEIFPVPNHIHARFSATQRTYHYFAHTYPDPFLRHYSWYLRKAPNVELMNEAAASLLNYSDFKSFCKAGRGNPNATTICKLSKAEWTEENGKLRFEISADRFLRNMVRAVVGTLLLVGYEKIALDEFKRIVESGERTKAGTSAKANGLFLVHIEYPNETFQKSTLWQKA